MHHERAGEQRPIRYPGGDDVEWVAVDRHGRIAVFTTGGVGPIPRAYLREPELLEKLTEALWRLPERSEAHALTDVARPDDYLAFARRGCFAFDWADVHRVAERSGRYELQASPMMPIAFAPSDWPDALVSLLESTKRADLDLAQPSVDVTALDCEVGS